jgi:hypothetical protein
MVQGLEFRYKFLSSGYKVWGSGIRVRDLESRV